MPPTLQLTPCLAAQLWAHARAETPLECVGVLGGPAPAADVWQASIYVPLPNVAPRPTANYQADARALIAALRQFRASGLELTGVFHSHPRGPAGPSPTDIAQAGYAAPYLIANLAGGSLRAFLLPSAKEVRLLYLRPASLLP